MNGKKLAALLVALLFLLTLQNRLAAKDQIPLIRIRFDNHANQFLVDEFAEVLDAVQRHLSGWNESADVVQLTFQAARVGAGNTDFHHGAFADVRPIGHFDRSTRDAEFIQTVFTIHAAHNHVER